MSNPTLEAAAVPARRKYLLGLPFWQWVLLAAAAGIGLLQTLLGDQGMANGYTWGVLMFAGLVCLVWFTFCSEFARSTRFLGAGVIVMHLGLVALMVRMEGFTGNMIPLLAWRFSPRPIEREPEAPPSPDVAPRVDLFTTTPQDFPQFLGPKRDGAAIGVTLERDWSVHPPTEVWRQPIGAGWSGFAVVNGSAVTLEQRGAWEMVTCYQVETGKLLWSQGVKTRYETLLGGVGPRSTPTIHQGRVYVLGATGQLFCLDGATGRPVWHKDLLKEFGLTSDDEYKLVKYGRANSPLIVEDLVIVPAGGPKEKARWSLAAFHQDNGALVWKTGNHNVSYSSPAFGVLAGVPQILSVNENQVSGHEVKTGKVLWTMLWPGVTSEDANVSQPVPVPPNRVFISKGYAVGAKLVELVPKGDGTFEPKQIYHEKRNMKTKYTNVTIKDGYVYGLSDGILECMKLDTGKKVWRDGAYGHGQILRVDDLLLVLSEEGELAIVEATPEHANHVYGSIQALTGRTWNNLALYGQYLLVRNGQVAACYRLAIRE